MCGIIGYIGNENAAQQIVGRLKKLEYRGYDSAGVAVLDSGKLNVLKAAGKVLALENLIDSNQPAGQIGIGHTRWATHGPATEHNAHPHMVDGQRGKIAIVHNGIIENYKELKTGLNRGGEECVSDTDTEVLGHMIAQCYEECGDLQKSVQDSLEQVEGTFGIVVLSEENPDTLIAARRGSPLLIGVSEKETWVASDATALIGRADSITYLEDGDVAVITGNDIKLFDISRTPQQRESERLELSEEDAQKGGYDHFLMKEIMEQPERLQDTIRGRLDLETGNSHLGGLNITDDAVRNLKRILIVACGSSYYAGLMGKNLLEKMLDIPVDVEIGSEFRYRNPVITDNTLGITISQSGETADTLAALEEMNQRGLHTIGLVNVVGSTLSRKVDGGMYLHVGPEISVASTKAFSAQVASLLMLGLHIGRRRDMDMKIGQDVAFAISKLPQDIENALKANDEILAKSEGLDGYEHAFYTGRDDLYPLALEGAIKLKEISYVHAEAYAGGELKHGPIALIDDRFLSVVYVAKGALAKKSLSNLAEIQARNGNTLVISNSKPIAEQEDGIFVKTSSPWTQAIVMNVISQLLAYHMANRRGTEIDQPRNLAKSVTVE